MTDIVIPIKELSAAKQRLASVLDPGKRIGLALAMLEDLLSVISSLAHGPVWIISSDERVFTLASRFGAQPIQEDFPRGYNQAVTLAFETIGAHRNIAVLPGDIPLATAADLTALIAPVTAEQNIIRLAASRDQMGTNGLFLSSKSMIDPDFGPGSFERHRRSAKAAGIDAAIVNTHGLEHDIDTPADLREFLDTGIQCATSKFLRGLGSTAINSVSDKRVTA
jgi:2-phospho-L-lactate guanylyltransferase